MPKREKLNEFADNVLIFSAGLYAMSGLVHRPHAASLLVAVVFAAFPLTLQLIVVVVSPSIKTRRLVYEPSNSPTPWVGIAAISILLAMVGFAVCGLIRSLTDYLLWINGFKSSFGRGVTVALFVMLAGALLFYFRLRARCLYGITEFLVGVAVAVQRILIDPQQAPLSPELYIPLLTASVYLIVRGLDNFHQGLTKEPKDPHVGRLIKWAAVRRRIGPTDALNDG